MEVGYIFDGEEFLIQAHDCRTIAFHPGYWTCGSGPYLHMASVEFPKSVFDELYWRVRCYTDPSMEAHDYFSPEMGRIRKRIESINTRFLNAIAESDPETAGRLLEAGTSFLVGCRKGGTHMSPLDFEERHYLTGYA